MKTLTRTLAEILDLDFLNHAWPLVSWPVLSDQKKIPHSTLVSQDKINIFVNGGRQ